MAHLPRMAQAKPAQPPPVYRPGMLAGVLSAMPSGRVSPTGATVQPKSVVQMVECGECYGVNMHRPGCSKHVRRVPKKAARKGTHTPGRNHDDGSGYQKKRAGGDRHQKGLRNQTVNANQTNFYREIKH
jgi:hypothetical protein